MSDRRPQLLLVGAGGLAREVATMVGAAGSADVLGYLDEDVARHGSLLGGRPVLGGLEEVSAHPEAGIVITVGRGTSRRRLRDRLTDLGVAPERFVAVVDPTVLVPPDCQLGPGAVILAGVVLTTDVRVGAHVVVMPHVTLTHDDILEDFVTVAAGVRLGGEVVVGTDSYLGMGSCVRERVVVGPRATLGMGAVLLSDMPADQTWVGNPARLLRSDIRGGDASTNGRTDKS